MFHHLPPLRQRARIRRDERDIQPRCNGAEGEPSERHQGIGAVAVMADLSGSSEQHGDFRQMFRGARQAEMRCCGEHGSSLPTGESSDMGRREANEKTPPWQHGGGVVLRRSVRRRHWRQGAGVSGR